MTGNGGTRDGTVAGDNGAGPLRYWPRRHYGRAVFWLCLGSVALGALAGFAVWPGEPVATADEPVATADDPEMRPVPAIANRSAADDDGWAGFAVVPERPAPDFELTASSGSPWSLAEQRGTVTLLVFGYTRCPDVCPQTLAKLEKAFARMGDGSAGVQVALVTTDPEYDTPEILSAYAAGFDLPLVGLTGTPDDVRAAGALYAAQPQIVQTHVDDRDAHAADPSHSHDGNAPVADLSHADHSSRVWLIDASGQLRVTFMGPFTIDDVVRDVGRLQAERL